MAFVESQLTSNNRTCAWQDYLASCGCSASYIQDFINNKRYNHPTLCYQGTQMWGPYGSYTYCSTTQTYCPYDLNHGNTPSCNDCCTAYAEGNWQWASYNCRRYTVMYNGTGTDLRYSNIRITHKGCINDTSGNSPICLVPTCDAYLDKFEYIKIPLTGTLYRVSNGYDIIQQTCFCTYSGCKRLISCFDGTSKGVICCAIECYKTEMENTEQYRNCAYCNFNLGVRYSFPAYCGNPAYYNTNYCYVIFCEQIPNPYACLTCVMMCDNYRNYNLAFCTNKCNCIQNQSYDYNCLDYMPWGIDCSNSIDPSCQITRFTVLLPYALYDYACCSLKFYHYPDGMCRPGGYYFLQLGFKDTPTGISNVFEALKSNINAMFYDIHNCACICDCLGLDPIECIIKDTVLCCLSTNRATQYPMNGICIGTNWNYWSDCLTGVASCRFCAPANLTSRHYLNYCGPSQYSQTCSFYPREPKQWYSCGATTYFVDTCMRGCGLIDFTQDEFVINYDNKPTNLPICAAMRRIYDGQTVYCSQGWSNQYHCFYQCLYLPDTTNCPIQIRKMRCSSERQDLQQYFTPMHCYIDDINNTSFGTSCAHPKIITYSAWIDASGQCTSYACKSMIKGSSSLYCSGWMWDYIQMKRLFSRSTYGGYDCTAQHSDVSICFIPNEIDAVVVPTACCVISTCGAYQFIY